VLAVVDRTEALREDRWPGARAVRQPVAKDPEIRAAFDKMTYRKGGAVIAMFEAAIGEQAFARAVRGYLQKHAWRSVDAQDLYAALGQETDLDVASAMDGFLSRPGLPLVDVSSACAGGRATLTLRQRPYRLLSSGAEADKSAVWTFPVCVAFPDGARTRRQCTLLTGRETTLALDGRSCPAWLHPNAAERGYYYYSVPADALRSLARGPALSEIEASGLVDNVDALLAAGAIDLPVAVDVLSTLASGARDHTQEEIARVLQELAVAAGDGPARDDVAAAIGAILGEAARKAALVPIRGEPERMVYWRSSLVGLVARTTRDLALTRDAAKLARSWIAGTSEPALLPLALTTAAAAGDATLFDELERLLDSDRGRGKQTAILQALAAFADPALTARMLALLGDRNIEWPPTLDALAVALARPEAHAAVVEFLRDRAPAMPRRFLGALPLIIASLCDPAQADQLAAILAKADDEHVPPAWVSHRALAQARQCAALRSHLGR
jgi:alanyl aminopeptidase